MDLLLTRILLNKLLTWRITCVDKEPASGSNVVIRCFKSAFHLFFSLLGCGVKLGHTQHIDCEGRKRGSQGVATVRATVQHSDEEEKEN